MWLIPAGYALFLALLVVRYVRRRPRLRDYPPQPHGPLVSVIVPARDEEVNIERCVGSLLATTYEPVEIIVVDDRSSDATPEIVERLARSAEAGGGLHLVRGAELPPGGVGEPWAIGPGHCTARGDPLVFTGADTP